METGRGFRRVSGTFLLFFMALGLATAPVWAQTTVNANWTDSTGNWTTAFNWSCNCIPNNSPANVFNVTIATGDVSLDNTSSQSSTTINTLSVGASTVSSESPASLQIENGESLNVTGNLTIAAFSSFGLYVDSTGAGGSTLHVGGNLTDSRPSAYICFGSGACEYVYGLQIGNGSASSASAVTVAGTFTNTSGSLDVDGGGAAGAQALLSVSGAAPSTLTGSFLLSGNTGGAAVEYGSGGITQIGDGSTNSGQMTLSGPNAFMELSNATGSDSALTGLKTIASNGQLDLEDGASLSTSGALTNMGRLEVDDSGSGGSTLHVGGNVTVSGFVSIGNANMNSASTVTVAGTLTRTGEVYMYGGQTAGAQALLELSGAAPSTLPGGNFELYGHAGGAAVEYVNGGITQIGDGSGGYVILSGPNAYLELSSAPGSNSALTGLKTIASNESFWLTDGAALATNGALTNNGSIVLNPPGYAGTGPETVLNVGAAAPSVLTGDYEVDGSTNGAALEYRSGGITQIGDGSTGSGNVTIDGSDAHIELTSATGENSALTGLKAIATNGSLALADGASLYTTGSLTNSGTLNTGEGGGTLSLGGALTNSGTINIENYVGGTGGNVNVGGNLANSGTLNFAGGACCMLGVKGDLTNSGQIEMGSTYGALDVSGNITNSGVLGIAAGMQEIDNYDTAAVSGSLINTGNLQVGMSQSAFGELHVGGNLTNAGNLQVATGLFSEGLVDVGGTYNQTAGSTDVDGTLMAPTVVISGGTLSGSGTITGNVVNDAVVSPGDPATMTIKDDYTQNADGTLVIDIASATEFSTLDVTGKASLDGTVDFDFLNGYVPGANTDFAFLQAGSVAGDFSTLDFVGINCPSCTFNVSTLSLDTVGAPPTFRSPTPEPGTLALFGTALLGLIALLRKRQGFVVTGS